MKIATGFLCLGLVQGMAAEIEGPADVPGLVCFWDFQNDGGSWTSEGRAAYALQEKNGPIKAVEGGVFGKNALRIDLGQWMAIPREKCPELNFTGEDSVSIVAWIKPDNEEHWGYIAGMWNETDELRQYALFVHGAWATHSTTMERTRVDRRTHAYVSDVGGATPGKKFCFSYATGKSELETGEWAMVAMTYDGKFLRAWLDGKLDENGDANPFPWDKPIFDPGDEKGSDFTVAQRAVPKWPGYPEEEASPHKAGFSGVLGGLAVFDRALSAEEMKGLYEATLAEK